MIRYILSILSFLTASVCVAKENTGVVTDSASNGNGYLRQFTEKSPLVYEDAWDLWPYSFLNEEGVPVGYNIELLQMIFKELNIPYIIKLKPTKEALQDLKNGNSDLMLGMDADFHDEYGIYGQAAIKLFTHSVVFHKSNPPGPMTLEDLAHQKVMVHGGSFSHHLMMERGWGDNAIAYDDMVKALRKVSNEKKGVVLWNTVSLKWLMYHHKMEDLSYQPIDVPYGKYKFMSNDPYLLAQLDSVYGELLSKDMLTPIQKKWLYPEYHETGIPAWVWNVAVVLGLIVLGLLLSYQVFRHREKKARQQLAMSNDRLSIILKNSRMSMWTYDIKTQMFSMIDDDGETRQTITSLQLARRFLQEDLERLLDVLDEMKMGKKEKAVLEMKAKENESATTFLDLTLNVSVLRRDKKGMPTVLFGALSDMTEERLQQQRTNSLKNRYQAVFNTAMVDMVYYDKDGHYVAMNQKASETFHGALEKLRSKGANVFDVMGLDKELFLQSGIFYATQSFHLPVRDGNGTEKIIMYELQLVPIYDDDNQLQGIYGTGRDVTEVYNTFHKQREGLHLLEKANEEKTHYINNINYALKVGGIRIAIYDPKIHQLQIYSQMNVIQHRLTQARCLLFADEEYRAKAMRMFSYMDDLTVRDIDLEVRTIIPYKNGCLFLLLHFVPVKDAQGQVISYFGMCRDISDIKMTEQLLAEETVRAQRTETEKNEFMRNMSYEIRTPLTNVIGFAELFQEQHTKLDEMVFIGEIKQNSSILLSLVNNILFLSRIDAGMVEITSHEVDFAQIFDNCCNDSWNDEKKKNSKVEYAIENPFRHLKIVIDDSNLCHVIRQVVVNAVQNTTSGSVRARYDYINDTLAITIEDTGCGISKEQLETIFDRFVSGRAGGTGLGLAICRELMQRMGGKILLKSSPKRGTTVWITLPCAATEIERI